jgi:quinol monooxygenase YgiN
MTIFILKINPRKGKRQELIELLRTVEDHVQLKTGCLECSILEECGENGTIFYMERWASSLEMHRHIQSPLYLRILAGMELANDHPQIHFYKVSETKGLELVESLRLAEVPERL